MYLALVINSIPLLWLLVIVVCMLVCLSSQGWISLVTMMRRMRWLLITMMIVFSFVTPGEYVFPDLFNYSPSYEGISAGMIQLVRFSVMLTGLSLLLSCSSQSDLVVGLYTLLKPLQVFKLKTGRFAVRLMLTMEYVEHAQVSNSTSIWQRLSAEGFKTEDTKRQVVRLPLIKFRWLDWLVLMLLPFSIWLFE
jgi:energy-coupling factor transporter transmembrane protein EcfT